MALCKTRTGNDRGACYHTPLKAIPDGPAYARRGPRRTSRPGLTAASRTGVARGSEPKGRVIMRWSAPGEAKD
mgnify:CR=1 FL=1